MGWDFYLVKAKVIAHTTLSVMKYLPISFFWGVILIAIGCNLKDKGNTAKMFDDSWSTLTIVSEHSVVIKIVNDSDTTIIETHNRGSIFTAKPKKVIIDTAKAYFTKAEKDTIFNLAREIVSHPVTNSRYCTDFVGDLDIFISYGDVRQSINYSGICDWNTLSEKSLKLHNLLRRIAKNVFLGE